MFSSRNTPKSAARMAIVNAREPRLAVDSTGQVEEVTAGQLQLRRQALAHFCRGAAQIAAGDGRLHGDPASAGFAADRGRAEVWVMSASWPSGIFVPS